MDNATSGKIVDFMQNCGIFLKREQKIIKKLHALQNRCTAKKRKLKAKIIEISKENERFGGQNLPVGEPNRPTEQCFLY